MGLEGLRITKAGLIPPKLWNRMIDELEAARITSFANGSFVRGKGGTTLIAMPSIVVPSLHVMALADFIPDPFAIVGQVMESLTTDLLAAMPSATAIAGVITAPLEAAAGSGASPGSVVVPVEALFGPAVAVLGTIEDRVQDLLSDINPVKTALEAHFAGENRRQPKNGDYIYTEEVGIVYVLFRQNDEGIPSGNTIFRVEFEIEEVKWVAVTTFPAPDIGALIGPIASMAVTLLKSLASAVVDAAVQAVAAGLIALYTALQALQTAIDALWEAIADILDLLNDLDDLIKDPETGILKKLADHQMLLDGLQNQLNDLADLLDELKDILDAAETVEVIGKDGIANTIKVLEQTTGVDLKSEFTWIQSSDGHGRRTKMILFEEPIDNVEAVDWREIDWISQTGEMMKAQILTFIDSGHEYPKEEAVSGAMELEDVEMCKDESSITKKLLIKPSE